VKVGALPLVAELKAAYPPGKIDARMNRFAESFELMTLDGLLNDFALRSFRDIADADYIAARMACRAALVTQFL
jgi:hypothetical protein